MNKWFTYVIECENGFLYKGYTNDVDKRFAKHKSGKGAAFTRINKPIRIVYYEEFAEKSDAIKREKYFKTPCGREWVKKKIKEQDL